MKLTRTPFLIFILLAFTVACGVSPISIDATLKGVQSAIAGGAGTFILSNGSMYFIAWPQGESYGFAVLSSTADAMSKFMIQAKGHGTAIDKLSISEIYKFLEDTGWKLSEVPPELKTAVAGASNWLGVFSRAPVIVVVPLGAMESNPILEQYQEVDG